jgi:hypothetical protein
MLSKVSGKPNMQISAAFLYTSNKQSEKETNTIHNSIKTLKYLNKFNREVKDLYNEN